jgi:DNA-binding Xre family transcriptional regulator
LALLLSLKIRDMIALVVTSSNVLALTIISYICPNVKTSAVIDNTSVREGNLIQVKLFEFWKQKEIELGRTIQVTEVSKATGISRDTLTRLKAGKTARPDLAVIDKLCRYFDIPTGTIPFLVYEED